MKEHNPNWLQIPDQLYRLLIIQSSERGTTKSLFSLTSHQPEKTYLYAKGQYEAKYQLLIKKQESNKIKAFKWF